MQGVGGGVVVAGEAAAEGGADGAGEDGEGDVEVDVEGDGAGEGVGVEGADGLGEALFDVHPPGVSLDELFRGWRSWSLVMMTVAASRPRPVTIELPDGVGVVGQGGGFVDDPGASVVAVAVQAHGAPGGGGQLRRCAGSGAGERIRRVRKVMPRSSSSASTAWVVTFWSITRRCGTGAGQGLPVLGEDEDLVRLGGLGQVGVGVDQGVAGAVLREERQHRSGALGT